MISIFQLAKKAISEVESVPLEYRLKTYEIIFQYYFQKEISLSSKSKNQKKSPLEKPEKSPDLQNILKLDFDWSSTNIPKLPALSQYLAVLTVVQDQFTVFGLSSSDLQTILLEKFRINKSINAVSMALLDFVGDKVDRTYQDSKYMYHISSTGRIYLDDVKKKLRLI